MLRRIAFLAVCAGALTVPGVAAASTINFPSACLEQSIPIDISGSGFTAENTVSIDGALSPSSASTDFNGAFDEFRIGVPTSNSYVPRDFKLTATDVNAANNTTATVPLVKFGSNMPTVGKSSAKVTWQFAGFKPGATIYGHFRFNNKKVVDYKFGKASGVCGTLSKKAKRVPAASVPKGPGGWYVQIDTKAKFSSNTRPEFDRTW